MNFIKKKCEGDRAIWMIFLFLCIISIIEGYSASSTLTFHTDYWRPIFKHVMFLLAGWGIVAITHSFHPKYFKALIIFLPVSAALIAITRASSKSINSSYRWMYIEDISFQPSELAKLSLIVSFAYLLSLNRLNVDNKKKIFWLMLIRTIIILCTIIVCIYIFLDNCSTAIMLVGVLLLMLITGQILSVKHILTYSSAIILFLIIFLYTIEHGHPDYLDKILPRSNTWKARFKNFFTNIDENSSDFTIPDNKYQEIHAKIAIANGGIFGRGCGNSNEKDFLPQAYSDFIYAIIIEETGLIGGAVILVLYLCLFIRAGRIAKHAQSPFSMFIVIGIAFSLVAQALTNMAVAVHLIPVTGQTLPLISRGGSSILINCIYFGIILSVSRHKTIDGKE